MLGIIFRYFFMGKNKAAQSHSFTCALDLEENRIKRLERAQRHGKTTNSLCSSTSTTKSLEESDFLDKFEQSIGVFGDSPVANGEAGQIFDYGQGLLKLHLADVRGEALTLMSHYVWNSALVMAEYIEAGNELDIQGKRVIELGAGAALPGLLCVKRGARFVTLTDYPDPVIIKNLERNWYENLVKSAQEKEARKGINSTDEELVHMQRLLESTSSFCTSTTSAQSNEINEDWRLIEQNVRCAVREHKWGTGVEELLGCLQINEGSSANNNESDNDRKYDRILLADTLWMSEGHVALLNSCRALLSETNGKIFLCCGLHTGFTPVQRFMALATGENYGFKKRLIEIRRMPAWGETRTTEELRQESRMLKEQDLEQFSIEDRNRTVLVYELRVGK